MREDDLALHNAFYDRRLKPGGGYDAETDSLYIDPNDVCSTESEAVSDGVVLDFGEKGDWVGFDIQQASNRTDVACMMF